MALYNSKPVFLILIPLLMMHRNSMTSFEFFNFSGPYTHKIFTYQGDASASNGVIQLTKLVNNTIPIPRSVGRVTYALPIHLWDSKTDKLASFTTTFSFLVAKTSSGFGDGISFFIAPFKSEIPEDSSGGYLGLFSPDSALQTSRNNHIVAVEFDTFSNPQWDPEYPHIGIDVNSIESVVTEPWLNDVMMNTTVFATVAYEAGARNLSVDVSYYSGTILKGSTISVSVSHVVDLNKVLPEWVSVGFSGATGQFVEVNNILSWSFTSAFY